MAKVLIHCLNLADDIHRLNIADDGRLCLALPRINSPELKRALAIADLLARCYNRNQDADAGVERLRGDVVDQTTR
ncbi:MAG: hypothetical protein HZC40_25445 [Chloroflexi bacterium]|nr:hypothetical protein [Chloroflexota bacterium]